MESLTSRHSGISNDIQLFSDSDLSLAYHYRVHKKGVPHVEFRNNYIVPAARSAAPACGSVGRKGIAGAWCFVNGGLAGGCGHLASTVQTYVGSQAHTPGQGDTKTSRTSPDRARSAGRGGRYGVQLWCMDVSGTELSEIRSMTRART